MLFRSKQKTEYEIRECDWSSDVCSSDLMMVATLQKELENKSDRIQDKIQAYRSSGEPQKLRMIKPEEGKLKKIRTKLHDRIAEIELRKKVDVSPCFIAGGVIKVS